ncbi:alkaline phosphatase family protein [Ruegeria lacuscaerulensis]|uniref:alkaline phosphatase family protein n=1 Tax=Ruegeria lacuscaerulensis TaxID=55218 RepID=UPI00147B86D8|nr:alkaline phosphatase family protein [Ruegeria lacuscaerulensis]
MTEKNVFTNAASTYLISRSTQNDDYGIWRMHPDLPELFEQVMIAPGSKFPAGKKLCPIGGYMISYDLAPLQKASNPAASYEIFVFDPTQPDPLNVKALQTGSWPKSKFWQFYDHYTWDATETDIVQLVPMTGYVMAYMPTAARGTYMLWNFDPAPGPEKQPPDPLPNAMGPQDAFALIGGGSELLPMGNYVLEWISAQSKYRVWNFDPQNMHPLALPAMSEGERSDMDYAHRLIALGEFILDVVPSDGSYRLWGFDPFLADPFVGPLKQGTLPQGFEATGDLTPVQTSIPVDAERAKSPGTMDFMRANIEHVVVYMLESRTMDSVLGWLYEADAPHLNYVHADPPFKANSKSNTNEADGKNYPAHKFHDGTLSTEFVLAAPSIDPFHSTADCIQQQFSGGYPAYQSGAAADMAGFVSNNLSGEAMVSFSPTQLPVLNGLAESFAVSDYWFSPMPGGTIANRGFALSGSNYNITVNCEGEPQYTQYAEQPLRQPIWKVLQNNGHLDWKIYYSVEWMDHVFTYYLYLRNQLPSVDKAKFEYVQPLSTFMADAAAGMLPKFSFVEPAWIAPNGATSYHPGATGDMVPAERTLNDIYQALVNSPQWDKTALVITFSKGGGLYDHVPPPAAQPAWPRDENDGFKYDVMGPRVPTIIVSPLVKSNTVFRSGQPQPYEGTSLLSTVLEWYGIPRARWGLGDRVQVAPTFESVFELSEPRTDKPSFTPPYDKSFPPDSAGS